MIKKTICLVGWLFLVSVMYAQNYCIPQTQNYCCGYGIISVTLPGVYQESVDAAAGYEDFSSVTAEATEGQTLPVSIQTGGTEPHDVRIWLDMNNDGTFDSVDELVFEALATTDPSGVLVLPAGTPFNTSLRLRVIADFAGSNPQPCQAPGMGQAEDYSFRLLPSGQAPVAGFSASTTHTCNGIVQFIQQATGNPTAYLWNFGDGHTSTEANPWHKYMADGTYSVSLTVSNSQGADTMAQTDYIEVNLYPTCDTFAVPTHSSETILYTCSYVLLDDGRHADYSFNSNGILSLSTVGAQSVCLRFLEFNFEYPYDYIEVYDGPTPAAPLLGHYSGSQLPPDFCSSGSSLCIRQVSDESVSYSGFMALSSCQMTVTETGEQGLQVFPNPFSTQFQVSVPASVTEPFMLILQSLTGQTVYQQTFSPTSAPLTLNTPELAPGLYVLTVKTRYAGWQQKLVKSK